MKMKFANKDHFLALARDAEKMGFNRQAHFENLYDMMDSNGTNIMIFSMLHEHIAGCKVDPHMRTMWYVKLKDTMEPATVFLDMTFAMFDTLPELNSEEIPA
jgi:hypothetical protein